MFLCDLSVCVRRHFNSITVSWTGGIRTVSEAFGSLNVQKPPSCDSDLEHHAASITVILADELKLEREMARRRGKPREEARSPPLATARCK